MVFRQQGRDEVEKKWVWLQKGSMNDLSHDENSLYLDSSNVNNLVVILHYSFATLP